MASVEWWNSLATAGLIYVDLLSAGTTTSASKLLKYYCAVSQPPLALDAANETRKLPVRDGVESRTDGVIAGPRASSQQTVVNATPGLKCH